MAIRQTAYSKGNARTEMPQPQVKGEVKEVILSYVFTEVLEIADILELFPLPSFGEILGVDFISENLPVGNVTIGFMSGDFASTDAARTSGAELFNAVSSVSGSLPLLTAALLQAPTEKPIAIGLKSSVQITAAANRKIHIRFRYSI